VANADPTTPVNQPSGPGHHDPLTAALAKLATETADPPVRRWLDALARRGEYHEVEQLPPPPPRPAATKRTAKPRAKRR
jgi:hypothetical protein